MISMVLPSLGAGGSCHLAQQAALLQSPGENRKESNIIILIDFLGISESSSNIEFGYPCIN